MRYYSQTTGCTYLEGLHVEIPVDAVPISEELFTAVIANAPIEMVRGHREGLPYLTAPSPPTGAELSKSERAWRDNEIDRVKWLRERHRDEQDTGRSTSIDAVQFDELLEYVQKLRDWPESIQFPAKESRPLAPNWIDGQG